jgi:hypothetical protein
VTIPDRGALSFRSGSISTFLAEATRPFMSAMPSNSAQREARQNSQEAASPQAVPRSVEEITSKLLMITEVKVGLGNRGLISVREGFLGHRRGCQ